MKMNNQLQKYKEDYLNITKKNKEIEDKCNEIMISKSKDLEIIEEKEKQINNLKTQKPNILQDNLKQKTNILNNINSDIAKLNSSLQDYIQENNILKEDIKNKNDKINLLNKNIKENIKEIESKNLAIKNIEEKNIQIQKDINQNKDNLNMVIHNGQQLFNDVSLKSNDYFFQIENI